MRQPSNEVAWARAGAQERAPAPSLAAAPALAPAPAAAAVWFSPVIAREMQGRLTLDAAMLSAPLARTARLSPFAAAPAEVRLSRGAKTAIIACAIVVGVLVIVGVVALSKPGKHL